MRRVTGLMAKEAYALLIYRATRDEPVSQDLDSILDAHQALQEGTASSGKLRAAAKLDESDGGTVVRCRVETHDITDGPYIEAKEWLVGFYLLDCDSREEALDRARSICPTSHHVVEVRRVEWRYES